MQLHYSHLIHPQKKEYRDSRREPTVEELLSPEVLRRAAQIKRKIRREEEPMMRELEDAQRLTAEDYNLRMNC